MGLVLPHHNEHEALAIFIGQETSSSWVCGAAEKGGDDFIIKEKYVGSNVIQREMSHLYGCNDHLGSRLGV